MFGKLLTLIFKNIRHRPLRGWLTILGVVIGIMLVVTILALSDGIKGVVSQTLQMFGSDIIAIRPGKATNPIESIASIIGGQRFRDADIAALAKIEGVRLVLPMDVASMNAEFDGEKKLTMIHGAPWREMRTVYEESKGFKLESGRWPTNDDAAEVVVGNKFANDLFKRPVRLGDDIAVKSQRLRVVGIVSGIGEQMADNVIYSSLARLRSLTGLRTGIIETAVKTEPGADIDLVSRQIEFELSKQNAVEEFAVLTPEKIGNIIGDVLLLIEMVLLMIAVISLIVGAVGIMNTMYTSVLERTKQIGIMRAIGATEDHILSLFLMESGLIGFFGGLLGIVFGLFMAYIVGAIFARFGFAGMFSFVQIDYFGLLAVLALTFIVGIISGVLPARRASKLNPSEALRYE